jgi:hypothetical protein
MPQDAEDAEILEEIRARRGEWGSGIAAGSLGAAGIEKSIPDKLLGATGDGPGCCRFGMAVVFSC